MGDEAQQVTHDAAIAASCIAAAHNQYQCTHGAYKNAQYFFIRNGLFQINGSYNHGYDRKSGGYDRGINRGSHRQSENIDSLIEYQCEECGKEYLQHIPVVYLLAFAEQ